MNAQKKMYKVLSPLEKKGGGTYWMRVGTAYTNKDDSINLYLDAMPPPNPRSQRFELNVREYTEEDRRKMESYRKPDLGGLGGGPSSRAVTASVDIGSNADVPF